MKEKVIILGGGISGLSAAYGLLKQGCEIHLLEKSVQVGGALRTIQREGYLAEMGPNSMQVTSPEMACLLGELGLRTAIVTPQAGASKRFLVKDNRPIAAPMGPIDFIHTPLFSATAKIRLLSEPFQKKNSNAHEESLADFTRRRLGPEVLDYAVNPMISGIYAGRPEDLSTQHAFPQLWEMEQNYGSLLKGALGLRKKKRQAGVIPFKPYLVSFSQGMQSLANALHDLLGDAVQVNCEIQRIDYSPHDKHPWRVQWSNGKQLQQTSGSNLILALPAHAILALPLPQPLGDALYDLAELSYPPLASLVLGFKQEAIQHPLDGFGMLVPAKENKKILGALFSSSLFSNRAPAGHHTLSVFIGGARQAELAKLPQDDLVAIAMHDLNTLLGLQGEPTFIEHSFWQKSIPQYNLGFGRFMEIMNKAENKFTGLRIIGNHRGGISVGQCLMNGLAVARET